MVTDCHCIIAHFIHQFDFYFSTEHIIIRCPLGNISAIEKQYILMIFAELFEKSSPADKTTFVIISVALLIDRFDTAMHIACL